MSSEASTSAVQVSETLSKFKNLKVEANEIAARRAEKAAKKAQQARENEQSNEPVKLEFLKRELLPVKSIKEVQDGRSIKLMTWNMLAQALVRRTLFPGCDNLKWTQRGHVLTQQIFEYSADIACLQEVDKMDYHGPLFTKNGYDYMYTAGYESKLHGLCVLWKKDQFELIKEKMIKLDETAIGSQDKGKSPARGCSRTTRNLGLYTALKLKEPSQSGIQGIMVVTHHLFWHPRHIYERARQVAILLQEIEKFRKELAEDGGASEWPCFLAGDFNVQPNEATYRFMTGAGLSSIQKDELARSTVVHKSVDEKRAKSTAEEQDGEDEDDEKDEGGEQYAQPDGDEDRVLKNTRPAREEDGLLSLEDLQEAYRPWKGKLISLYGHYLRDVEGQEGNHYGDRASQSPSAADGREEETKNREGFYEPAYTSYTPLWNCTLDYIFHVPPLVGESIQPQVTHLLPTHREEILKPGLPRKGKEPSDHMALMARIIL